MEKGKAKRDAKGRLAKGCTANPHGRPPRAKSVTTQAQDILQHKFPAKDDPKRTSAWRVARALIEQALNGNVSAAKELMDRTEGKVPLPMTQAIHGEVRLVVVEDR